MNEKLFFFFSFFFFNFPLLLDRGKISTVTVCRARAFTEGLSVDPARPLRLPSAKIKVAKK